MANSFADKVNHAWYQGGLWIYLLAPLSLLYALVIFLKARLQSKPQQSRVPVIVVGNITAGGTGKSPLVSYLVRFFQSKGYRVGIVSRGYGVEIPKSEVRFVQGDSFAGDVGDEPLMLKRLLQCDIALCPQRALAVAALEDLGCELIISDDGLQHAAMYRDLELCVIDQARGLGNGWLLPTGPLREPKSRLKTVDAIVLNSVLSSVSNGVMSGDAVHEMSEPNCLPGSVPVSYMQLNPQEFEHIESGEIRTIEQFLSDIECSQLKGAGCRAVAGIGNPQRFFDTLSKLGLSCDAEGFPDHYAFSKTDFPKPGALILMTEKDAAKCRGLGLESAWLLRVRPELQDKLADNLYNRLIALKRLQPR
jgi:tetraacyldisaccharide 4'-kinase